MLNSVLYVNIKCLCWLCSSHYNLLCVGEKPLLKKEIKFKRQKWTQQHKDRIYEHWYKLLWTDESQFDVFGRKRKVVVRWTPFEWMSKNYFVPIVK